MLPRHIRIQLAIILVILFAGCAKYELPSINDPKYVTYPAIDADKNGVIDEKDVQVLEAKANDCLNTLIIPVYKKVGIEINAEQDINTKENTEILKNNITVTEWEKLIGNIDEWNKFKLQLESNKAWVDKNPVMIDYGTVGDFIANNECSLYFWFKEGRQAQLIGVGTPNNTSGYMLMSRDMFYKLALGKGAKIEYDTIKSVKVGGKDQVLLVYLHIGKKFINAEMIAKGYARAKPMPPNSKYDTLFMKLEKEAKEKKRGIWALTKDF